MSDNINRDFKITVRPVHKPNQVERWKWEAWTEGLMPLRVGDGYEETEDEATRQAQSACKASVQLAEHVQWKADHTTTKLFRVEPEGQVAP